MLFDEIRFYYYDYYYNDDNDEEELIREKSFKHACLHMR